MIAQILEKCKELKTKYNTNTGFIEIYSNNNNIEFNYGVENIPFTVEDQNTVYTGMDIDNIKKWYYVIKPTELNMNRSVIPSYTYLEKLLKENRVSNTDINNVNMVINSLDSKCSISVIEIYSDIDKADRILMNVDGSIKYIDSNQDLKNNNLIKSACELCSILYDNKYLDSITLTAQLVLKNLQIKGIRIPCYHNLALMDCKSMYKYILQKYDASNLNKILEELETVPAIQYDHFKLYKDNNNIKCKLYLRV